MKPTVSVLVLNFNGRELLKKYLPSFETAVQKSGFKCKLGVVDNASVDGSVDFLKSSFPDVAVYEVRENRVLCSYNEIAEMLQEDVLIFVNNDILADVNFVDPLVEPFTRDDETFFVTPRCLSMKDRSYEGNKTKAWIKFGVYWSSARYPGYEKGVELAGPTIQGGFGAFDRKIFLELGGYDDLYLPGRLEDADICFRAYKKGWKCLYEPKSIVYHEGGVSFHKAFGVRGTLVINWRNTFFFMWKNLSDSVILMKFLLWLPVRLVYSILARKPEFFLGFVKALPHFGKVLKRRRELKASGLLRRVPDRWILNQV